MFSTAISKFILQNHLLLLKSEPVQTQSRFFIAFKDDIDISLTNKTD